MAENTHCLRVYSDRISKGKPRKRFDITPVIYIFVKTDTMKERIERILKEIKKEDKYPVLPFSFAL